MTATQQAGTLGSVLGVGGLAYYLLNRQKSNLKTQDWEDTATGPGSTASPHSPTDSQEHSPPASPSSLRVQLSACLGSEKPAHSMSVLTKENSGGGLNYDVGYSCNTSEFPLQEWHSASEYLEEAYWDWRKTCGTRSTGDFRKSFLTEKRTRGIVTKMQKVMPDFEILLDFDDRSEGVAVTAKK